MGAITTAGSADRHPVVAVDVQRRPIAVVGIGAPESHRSHSRRRPSFCDAELQSTPVRTAESGRRAGPAWSDRLVVDVAGGRQHHPDEP